MMLKPYPKYKESEDNIVNIIWVTAKQGKSSHLNKNAKQRRNGMA